MGFSEFEVVDSLVALAQVLLYFEWRVSGGEDVEQVGIGDEVETWEGFLLSVNKLLPSLFAEVEFFV